MAEKLSSPNLEEQQPQEPINPEPQEKKEQSILNPEQILEMSPKEMADLFSDLDSKGELQSFLESSAENPSLVAQFSYWEKWLQKDQRRLVDETVAQKREAYEGEEDKESLPLHLEKRFTPEELSLIFSNMGAIQLTFGCSKGCPFCGFDAVPEVREHIPYPQLANLFQKFGKELGQRKSQPFLYWASEPSDYASKIGLEDKTYQDVHQLATEYAGYSPGITSKEINDDEWVDYLIAQSGEKNGTARISTFGLSVEKREKLRERVGKNITFAMPPGADPRKEQPQPAKLGISFVPKPDGKVDRWEMGIGCFDGTLLTPRGLYNVLQVPPSEKFPQGQVVIPIENLSDDDLLDSKNVNELFSNCVLKTKFSSGGMMGADMGLLVGSNHAILVGTGIKTYKVMFKEDFLSGEGRGEIESITDVTEKALGYGY